jgi:predicted outer membrane protein
VLEFAATVSSSGVSGEENVMRKPAEWMAAGLLVALGGAVLAQEAREPARAPRADQGARTARPGQWSVADQQIAACKLGGCRNEVELAKLAQEKASSPEVKAFAERMIREHTPACEKLEQVAGPLAAAHDHGEAATGRDRPARPDADAPAAPRREGGAAREEAPREGGALREGGAPREAAPRRAAPNDRAAADAPAAPADRPAGEARLPAGEAAGGELNWVRIHDEVSQQCLASAKKELGSKEGAEFDKCYINMAIGSHQKGIDMDQVFLKHASQQFKGDLQAGIKMATTHLEQAKSICKQLEGSAERVTRRPK